MKGSDGIAIRVTDLSKKFNIYTKPSDMLWEMFERKPRYKEFWALKDITFDVRKGEVVGVIGRNGSGKTTMLRIIASTLEKTGGHVETHGKVAAIMALGMGFNVELSGRENILIGGLCLGMTKEEILAKTESIIDFSGLEAFIDQPCRTYSSGMLARLAFSTAISVEPDIFIIDEALSVGDMAFGAKCFTRIRKIARSGATVFFVSHDLQSVYSLCHKAILLDHGQIVTMGEPRKVGSVYEQIMHNEMAVQNKRPLPVYCDAEVAVPGADSVSDVTANDQHVISSQDLPEEGAGHRRTVEGDAACGPHEADFEMEAVGDSGGEHGRILETCILDSHGKKVYLLHQTETYTIRIRAYFAKDFKSLSIGFRLQAPSGTAVYGTSSPLHNQEISARAGEVISIDFSFECTVAVGAYFLSVGIAEMLGELSEYYHYTMLHFVADAATVQVSGPNKFAGMVDLNSRMIGIHREQSGKPASDLRSS